MRIQSKIMMAFFVLAAFVLLPCAVQASGSIACWCTDNDADGYGNPASTKCTYPGLDCDDNWCDDPPQCAGCTCGTPECGPCARCRNPGAVEVCDGVDNDCDGLIDEEPDASASCDDGIWCNGTETCDSGSCQAGTPPCQDDGSFCNGSESCDEENDQCLSSGNPCSDTNPCTGEVCNEEDDTCSYPCSAAGYEDPCCEDDACVGALICKEPVCGDGVIDPGEECGEPGLSVCPSESPFCVECACSPIAIALDDFTARGGDGSVLIRWGTGSEIATEGFNLLRSEGEFGEYVQINADLIPAQGGPSQGADYSFTDNDVVNGRVYWYKLQEVESDGTTNLFGPVSTLVGAAGCAASDAEASEIGTSSARPLDALYPLSLPLLFAGVWLGIRICRRRR
jgi:hypothetical protein